MITCVVRDLGSQRRSKIEPDMILGIWEKGLISSALADLFAISMSPDQVKDMYEISMGSE